MPLRHLGYAAKNTILDRTTGRTLRLANLTPERGEAVARENLDALEAILRWNEAHGIRAFRISSGLVPFASHPALPFDWRARLGPRLREVGALARELGHRLTMHPGQYTVLNAPDPDVVERAVAELVYHADALDLLGAEGGTMTLHVGGAYGDPAAALERFERHLDRLPARARSRLAIENDDRTFDARSVLDLARRAGLPMILDLHHHRAAPGPYAGDPEGALPELATEAASSWRASGRVPKVHLSSPRSPGERAHADELEPASLRADARLLDAAIDGPWDAIVEAKAKERAVLAARAALAGDGAPPYGAPGGGGAP